MSKENKTFTHSELKDFLASEFGEGNKLNKKEADELLKMLFGKITKEVTEGRDVKMLGFGTAKRVPRKAREGRNPRNPEEVIKIPAHYTMKVTIEKSVKEKLKELEVSAEDLK